MRLHLLVGLGVVLMGTACRPSDVLSVPAPAGALAGSALRNQAGAEGAFNGARTQMVAALESYYATGLLTWATLLTDETTFSDFNRYASFANTDARQTTAAGGFGEYADFAWGNLVQARAALLGAVQLLAQYEPASGRSKVGEAYALAAYTELFFGEAYCAGTTLDAALTTGTIAYGAPLTTDSLFGVAEAHFDSALAAASGDATIGGLAAVGLGRVLLDRGQYAAAAAAVANVPASFIYNGELAPASAAVSGQSANLYAMGAFLDYYRMFNVADGEGGNGLNFVSAHDPRLTLDTTTYQTRDGVAWRLPTKFEVNLTQIPLATGIEAQLISAEAALHANQVAAWLASLNTLRNSGCTVSGADTTCTLGTGQVATQAVGLPSLADPGSDSARVSLMFRERAFWLYGTGTRLGDLRRLIRRYGRPQNTVFPTGAYPNGAYPALPQPIPNYGTDVSLTLPTPAGLRSNGQVITNPNYKGCIAPTGTA